MKRGCFRAHNSAACSQCSLGPCASLHSAFLEGLYVNRKALSIPLSTFLSAALKQAVTTETPEEGEHCGHSLW